MHMSQQREPPMKDDKTNMASVWYLWRTHVLSTPMSNTCVARSQVVKNDVRAATRKQKIDYGLS